MSGMIRKILHVLSVAYPSASAGPAFWTLAPVAIGWRPVVIVGGSMMPAVHRGDVVVSSPLTRAETWRPGHIVVMDRPGMPGQLVTHRIAGRNQAGQFITRGDANRDNDGDPVTPAAIRGVARLRVPAVGLPVYWLRDHRYGPVAVWMAVTAIAVANLRVPSPYRPAASRRPRHRAEPA